MATYKEIKGVTIQTQDEDPVLNVGTWSSGGDLNTGRSEFGGGGIQTSAMAAGGRSASSPPGLVMNNVEIYDGTNWTETTEINTSRRNHGAGGTANTAILIWGGLAQPSPPFSFGTHVESWNGSAWTEVTECSAKGGGYGSIGTYTSTIAMSGSPSISTVETWNGSAWTEVNELNNDRGNFGVWGTVTSALIGAGNQTSHVETWDGSSWSETTELSNIREGGSASGDDSTSGIIFGGNYDPVGYLTKTESWNGSAWTEVNDLAIAKVNAGGGGTSVAGIGSGGAVPLSPSYGSATEEFSFPPPTAAILTEGSIFLSAGASLKGFGRASGIPSASWASAPSLNTARSELTGSQNGTQDAMLAFGSPPNVVESYNGTSWSEVNETSSSKTQAGGLGTQTAAILCFGNPPAGGGATPTEEWNGSSWTEKNDGNTGRYVIGACGTTTAGLAAGGLTFPPAVQKANTESWDGTSWTEVNDMNTASRTYNIAGVQTSSISAGRGEPNISNVETWNGTSWSEVAEINTPRREGSMSGFDDGNALLISGDSGPPLRANTEFWNGSSWTELNDVSTARRASTGGASAAKSIIFGGNTGSATGATEEWTADNTLSTVTVS